MTRSEMARRLGARVRELREARGWTQGDLTIATAGVNGRAAILRPNVARFERGRGVPSTETVVRLARALGVQPSAIFGALDEPAEEAARG